MQPPVVDAQKASVVNNLGEMISFGVEKDLCKLLERFGIAV